MEYPEARDDHNKRNDNEVWDPQPTTSKEQGKTQVSMGSAVAGGLNIDDNYIYILQYHVSPTSQRVEAPREYVEAEREGERGHNRSTMEESKIYMQTEGNRDDAEQPPFFFPICRKEGNNESQFVLYFLGQTNSTWVSRTERVKSRGGQPTANTQQKQSCCHVEYTDFHCP